MSQNKKEKFVNPPSVHIHENGYVELDSRWRHGLLSNPHSCFYIVEDGDGFLVHDGKKIDLKPGYAYLIPASTPFSFGCSSFLRKLFFHINVVGSEGFDILRNLQEIHSVPLKEGEIEELVSYYQESSISDAYAFRSVIYRLFARVLATYPEDKIESRSYSPLIGRAVKYIQENLSVRLSIAEVAASLFVAEGTLRKHFKKEIGLTPRAYIEDLALWKAETLLRNTNLTIAEIAAQLGFCDQFYFTRRFSLRYRRSPRLYRADVRQETRPYESPDLSLKKD